MPRDDVTAAVIEDQYGLLSGRPKLPTGARVRELVRSGDVAEATIDGIGTRTTIVQRHVDA